MTIGKEIHRARKIKSKNLEVIQRGNWIKVRGYVWCEGKGGKGFEKPLFKVK